VKEIPIDMCHDIEDYRLSRQENGYLDIHFDVKMKIKTTPI
jgi:hypothetical protein